MQGVGRWGGGEWGQPVPQGQTLVKFKAAQGCARGRIGNINVRASFGLWPSSQESCGRKATPSGLATRATQYPVARLVLLVNIQKIFVPRDRIILPCDVSYNGHVFECVWVLNWDCEDFSHSRVNGKLFHAGVIRRHIIYGFVICACVRAEYMFVRIFQTLPDDFWQAIAQADKSLIWHLVMRGIRVSLKG